MIFKNLFPIIITNEEDPNIYYHSFDKIDNKNNNLLSSKEYSLFKKDINNPNYKPKKNSNFRNNVRHKERKSRYENNDNII